MLLVVAGTMAQFMPRLMLEDEAANQAVVKQGLEHTKRFLAVLDDLLKEQGRQPAPLILAYACGEELSLADFVACSYLTNGQWVGHEFTAYPNVDAYVKRLKTLPHYEEVYGPFEAAAKQQVESGKPFITLQQ